MAPTFWLILSWPSHKTFGLFALGSGVCTCTLELPSWHPLLCPSVTSLILKFSILIRRLWASLAAPLNPTFPSLSDFSSADIWYPSVHFSSYTANVTAYLSGLILDKCGWLYCIFNVKKLLQQVNIDFHECKFCWKLLCRLILSACICIITESYMNIHYKCS